MSRVNRVETHLCQRFVVVWTILRCSKTLETVLFILRQSSSGVLAVLIDSLVLVLVLWCAMMC